MDRFSNGGNGEQNAMQAALRDSILVDDISIVPLSVHMGEDDENPDNGYYVTLEGAVPGGDRRTAKILLSSFSLARFVYQLLEAATKGEDVEFLTALLVFSHLGGPDATDEEA